LREGPASQIPPWSAWLPIVLAAAWIAGLMLVFWYPFDFRTDGAFLRMRLDNFLTRVPFEAYYYGTEFRAATELLHKVLFFIPLGALLGWFVSRLRWTWRGYGSFFSLILILCMALIVVAGRLAQPEKNPDSMDVVLQWMGGALGFVMARVFFSRKILTRYTDSALFLKDVGRKKHKFRQAKLSETK